MATTSDQLPGCTIPDKCMTHADKGLAHDTFCDNDLKCICRVDNHLGTNKLFSSECLLKECTDGHGRRAFLRDWLESCREAGKSGWDEMPWEWEPYLPNDGEIVIRPSAFLNAPSVITSVSGPPPSVLPVLTSTAAVPTSVEVPSLSTTSSPKTTLSTSVTDTAYTTINSTTGITLAITISSSSNPGSEATSPAPPPIVITLRSLSAGAIGGVVAGILTLTLFCAILGYFYWKSNKKAERTTREVAILSDKVSGRGFQKYIDDLLADSNTDTTMDSNSLTGTIVRRPAPTAVVAEMPAGSTSTVNGVVSQSSSVYSMDIARAI